MSDVQRLKERILADPEARAIYDEIQPEFVLLDAMLAMREQAGLTQSELALRMKKNKGNLSRMEKPGTNPTWSTVQSYAAACGFRINSIEFEPLSVKKLG